MRDQLIGKSIDEMTDEEFDAYMERPKTCTKCKQTLTVGDFPVATARGRRVVRSWCSTCLEFYYRQRTKRLTQKRREARAAATFVKPGRDAK